MSHVSVALEGIRGTGKSTLTHMLYERSENAIICEKRSIYPYYMAKNRVYAILNNMLTVDEWKKLDKSVRRERGADRMSEISAEETAYQVGLEFPHLHKLLQDVLEYSSRFGVEQARKQAFIAYLYTADRREATEWVKKQLTNHDVIFDRWRLSGCAYQETPGYGWRDIKNLHDELGVLTPDLEVVLTLPLDQINGRRYFRLLEGARGVGPMVGRVEANLEEERRRTEIFLEMARELKEPSRIVVVENKGTGIQSLRKQIEQALPAYWALEGVVRETGFRLKGGLSDAAEGWDDPEILERIGIAQG